MDIVETDLADYWIRILDGGTEGERWRDVCGRLSDYWNTRFDNLADWQNFHVNYANASCRQRDSTGLGMKSSRGGGTASELARGTRNVASLVGS